MYEAEKEWICPENFPSLKGYSHVAIDLETKDPELKSMGSGAVRGHGNIVGIAVAVDEGFLVPVLRYADGLSLSQISVSVKDFAKKAKEKKFHEHSSTFLKAYDGLKNDKNNPINKTNLIN